MLMLIAFCVLLVATIVIDLVEKNWSLPIIVAAAGGLQPFDLRWTRGYTLGEAKGYLAALNPAGAAFYRGPQHILDFFLLLAFGLAGGVAIYGLGAPLGNWRWALLILPLAGALFDLGENLLVGEMLKRGPDGIDVGLVDRASICTGLKAVFLALTWLVIAGEFVWWIVRHWPHAT